MATAPRLAPDPFDRDVEEMLRDPEVIADLDEQHASVDRGELTLHSTDEVRARLRGLSVPLLPDRAAGT